MSNGLKERTTALRGAFTPEAVRQRFAVREWEPPADLEPWVSHLWRVQWDLPPDTHHIGRTLPFPVVHIVFEDDGTANVVGPIPVRFERRLEGRGGVVGVHVRPAMFRALCDVPQTELLNQRVDAQTLFGPRVAEVAAATPELSLNDRCLAICAWLRSLAPASPPALLSLRDVVEEALRGEVADVGNFAARLGVSERTALRRCKDAIGWTPARIVRRYRVHEALAKLDMGAVDLADLALSLGYADQAHFSREFKSFTGMTPREYARSR